MLRNRFALISLVGLCVSTFIGAAETARACTYFAAPDTLGDPQGGPFGQAINDGSFDAPIRIQDFWTNGWALPGTTLCLRDGLYHGDASMITPPSGLSGTSGQPIVIKGLTEGAQLIDGEGARAPVVLTLNNYWELVGFNAANSSGGVVAITGVKANDPLPEVRSHHVRVARVVAWNAKLEGNYMVFDINRLDDSLLEDVAGFGSGRKIFQIYHSDRVTVRRAWGRWDGYLPEDPNNPAPTLTFACAYGSYDVICENVLATWSGSQLPAGSFGGPVGILIGSEGFDAEGVSPTGDPYDAGLLVAGSIAYATAGVPNPPKTGLRFSLVKEVDLVDVVSYMAGPDQRPLRLGACVSPCGDYVPPSVPPFNSVDGITEVGDNSQDTWREDHWGLKADSDLVSSPISPVANIYNGTAGARLCHQYVDGIETTTPLWPWRMNERIRTATLAATGIETNVDATMQSLFGAYPSECKLPNTGCGLGSELVVVVPVLLGLKRKRSIRVRPT